MIALAAVHARIVRAAALAATLTVAVAASLRPPAIHAASPCEWRDIAHVVAVGDVHGAYDRFVEILKTAAVIDAAGHWSAGATHFVQLGDLVDRGGDSRKVLDLVRRLEREAQAAGGQAHILLGNHEAARMLGDLRLTVPAEYAAFATADSARRRDEYFKTLKFPSTAERDVALAQTPPGFVEMREAFGRDGEYGRWLRQLPATITINGIVFAHGGISPSIAPMGCAAINDQVHRELGADLDQTRAAPLESLTARVDGPLWYRGLAQEPDSFAPQVDAILSALDARAIVIAHTVTATGRVTPRFDGRVIQIDTGMQPAYVQGGRASALDIGNDATAIYVDRRDPVPLPKRSRD
jgi:hypothetical protein